MSFESNSPTSQSQGPSEQNHLQRSANVHSASTAIGSSGGQSFFEKERARLVGEIAEGIEILLSDSNSLNRKIEESISVGKEFEPIAALWGRFSEIMKVAGFDPSMLQEAENLSNSQSASGNNESNPESGSSSSKHHRVGDREGLGGNEDAQKEGEFTTPKASSKSHVTNPLNQSAKKSLNRSRNANDENEAEIFRKSQGGEFSLPAGVAPGGGMVYGQD